MRHRWLLALSTLFLIAVGVLAYRRYGRYPGLPYRDRFAEKQVSEWTPYGGIWHLSDGIVRNRSDEGGAKLVTGSPRWQDYQLTADLQLNDYGGDVGLVVRAGHLRNGIYALHGYYAELRSETGALVLGIANDNHLDRLPQRVAGGLRNHAWYRLHVVVVGCEVAAEATDLSTGRSTYSALRDHRRECFKSGRIALRSDYGGGAWRNVHAEGASVSDLHAIEQRSGPALAAEYPIRESDYARMWDRYFADHAAPAPEVPRWVHENELRQDDTTVTDIATIRSMMLPSREVRLRGTVTSADPQYVQDATAGIRFERKEREALNVGDEIEATGQVELIGNEQVLHATGVRLLWDRTPLTPAAIAPAQASSGQLDGSLIEVSGTLISSEQHSDGSANLRLRDSSQLFTVKLQRDVFSKRSSWSEGSTLRVHGICTATSDPSSEGAFTVLAASAASVQILAGPSWWSGWRLLLWIALAIAIIACGVWVYIQGERSKMRAIMRERERLAHDMHDTLAQSFAGVAYYLQGVRKSLVEVGVPQPQVQDVSVACEMVAAAHRDASASIAALHPDSQKDGDLLTMLERAAASMLEGSSLPIELRREGMFYPLSPTVTDVLFRVGREAITNVLRHAQATSLTITLAFGPRSVLLRVADNGVGMNLGSAVGFGLQGMRQRCDSVGASLEVISAPNQGCTVEVRAPYARQNGIPGNVISRFQRLIRR